MARFFDPQRGGWKALGYLADVLILSCLWLVCSLPIVTLGAATAALYDCAVRCVRQKDPALLSRFFRTFRAELKGSIPTTLLWEVLLAGLFLLVRLYGNTAAVNDVSVVLTVAGLCLVGFALGVFAWVFPLLSRFTFSFSQLNVAALRLAMGHLPATILLGLGTMGTVYLCLRFALPVFLMPALLALLASLPIERAFQPYMEENELA